MLLIRRSSYNSLTWPSQIYIYIYLFVHVATSEKMALRLVRPHSPSKGVVYSSSSFLDHQRKKKNYFCRNKKNWSLIFYKKSEWVIIIIIFRNPFSGTPPFDVHIYE